MGNAKSRESVVDDDSSAAATSRNGNSPVVHPASSCPVPEQYRSRAVYNVYNQRIDNQAESSDASSPRSFGLDVLDPKNNMPLEPNQQPCPGQRKLLSTERCVSTIPKGGTDFTWLYPSPQMFYNGMSSFVNFF